MNSLDRKAFLRVGSFGAVAVALEACSGAAPSLQSLTSNKPNPQGCSGGTIHTFHGAPNKFGIIPYWQLNAKDCDGNLVGQLIIYSDPNGSIPDGTAQFWFQGKGSAEENVNDPKWTKNKVIKLYDDLITPGNNGALVSTNASQPICSVQCYPSSQTYQAVYYLTNPAEEEYGSYALGSGSGSGSLRSRGEADQRSIRPMGCLSARLNFGAACTAEAVAALTAETGIGLLAIVGGAMWVASGGLEMSKECH